MRVALLVSGHRMSGKSRIVLVRHEKLWIVEVYLRQFLSLAPDGLFLSLTLGMHLIGGWMDPIASPDALEK